MNRQLRRLAVVLMALFVILFAQLNVLQVARADKYRDDPRNTVELARDQARARGRILSADGQVLAQSVPVQDRFEWQRQYPLGDLFAHPVGAFSPFYGADGVEQTFNDVLVGETSQQKLRNLGNLFSNKQRTGDVQTTLRSDLQQVAKDALGDREGSVAVIDPRTGAILALWSWPSYDPNTVAGHDPTAAEKARKALLADPAKPLLANAYQERYMPGSTFKIVTTTAALMNGVPVDRVWETERSYTPPDTKNPINNYGRELCGGDFATVFKFSCNTPFARLGNELGAETMVATTKAFGIGETIPLTDLPAPATSFFGEVSDFAQDQPRLAQSSFGQNAVSIVPLHLAMIAGTVANGGRMMKPYVVSATVDGDGTALQRHTPSVWKTPMTPEVANTLNGFMVGVAQAGTARCCLKLASGAQAAAKTGTAQLRAVDDPRGPSSHAWITAFAPADAPKVAVAVMVKASDEVTAGVGGTVAGPVARAVLDKALEVVP